MKRLITLKRQAENAAKWRHHALKPWTDTSFNSSYTECRLCGASISVKTKPQANDIDIGGSAVAVGCVPKA